MKRHTTLALGTLLLALAGAIAAPAMADDDRRGRHGYYHRDDDDRYDRGHRGRWHGRRGEDDRHWRVRHDDDRHGHGHGHSYWDRSDPRRVVYVGPPVVRYRPVRHDHHYGPPPWARGRPYNYYGYGPTYVVHDYRPYRLYAPPRGHYWRRSDAGDFLLVAITSGIIADVVLNR